MSDASTPLSTLADAPSSGRLFPGLAARLPIGRLGRAFHAFQAATSTQDELRRLAEAGAPEGTVVVADHQTRGRGRHGRQWLDAPGANLLVSVLLRPEIPPARVPQLSLLAVVAAAEALTLATGVAVGIRWPNDLQVGERKLGGILAEAVTAGERVEHVTLGLGINVNQTEFPADLAPRVTSLALEARLMLDREAILEALLGSLDRWYARYLREGFAPVRAGWCRASLTLGQPVSTAGVTGVAEDLDADGALIVRTREGTRVRLVAGELR
ncbi:MAG: biotin--[acetyl-CoA-carboxylase] ligase [Candidatus Rokubacteria bacterium]|nr:biotin--[acetyl-CoA-carboxylase] ligase [Candidatus Rokubacteria bacterium]